MPREDGLKTLQMCTWKMDLQGFRLIAADPELQGVLPSEPSLKTQV